MLFQFGRAVGVRVGGQFSGRGRQADTRNQARPSDRSIESAVLSPQVECEIGGAEQS